VHYAAEACTGGGEGRSSEASSPKSAAVNEPGESTLAAAGQGCMQVPRGVVISLCPRKAFRSCR
jgi:hypothetical protein